MGLRGLDRRPDVLTGGQLQVRGRGLGDVGGHRDRAGELDAQVVAVPLDAGDDGRPGVARAAVRPLPVQRDGRRAEGHERVPGQRVGRGERDPVDLDAVSGGLAAVQVQADQPGHVVGARLGGHRGGVALLDDPAVLDDDQPVGEDEGVQRIVGDQQRGARMVGEVAVQFGAGVQPGTGVERGERLVEQQQLRRDGQRAGQGDPLRLPAGQVPRLAPGVPGQPDPVQPPRRLLPCLPPGYPVPARPERDVVQRGQVREEQVLLEHHTDRPVLRRRPQWTVRPVQFPPAQPQVPGRQRPQPGQRPQRRGLARAVRAEQRDHLPGGDAQPGIEAEPAEVDDQVGVQQGGALGHGLVIQRSRSAARTATETVSRMRLSTVAAFMSVSSAR